MIMSEYGTIRNPSKARQLNIFSGLSSAGIDATDIDGLIEYRNLGYVIYEVKHKGVDVPLGQRLALERMVNDFAAVNKRAIAMVVEHNIDDPNIPISVKDCSVRVLYCSDEKRWRPPKKYMTAGMLTDIFLKRIIHAKEY